MKIHQLKIQDYWYEALKAGNKTFEIRKNDRDFKVGDKLIFHVLSNGIEPSYLTAEEFIISHILNAENFPNGLKEGYVCLSLKRTY
jgi:ParB family chromosome partitioning protein